MNSMKQFLKSFIFTKHIYKVLFHCKYNGVKSTLRKINGKILGEENKIRAETNNAFADTYMLPLILRENEGIKKVEVVSCAFRKHEPEKGLTGGPNGVLATERKIFGDMYHGMRMRYIFWSKNVKYPKHLEEALKGVTFMVKMNFYAAYYLEYCTPIWGRLRRDTDFIFVCHEIGFAYGAFLRNCRYVLVYHNQGSLVNERESFGEIFTERDKELSNKLEEAVFYNAEKVYFPSLGAKNSFIATTKIDVTKVNFADEPLYNTIQDIPPNLNKEKLLSPLNLKIVDHSKTDVFLSVGDFSENKGMERIPLILNKYVERTGRDVYWIAIGSKHKAGIFDTLVQEQNNWKFETTLFGERVNHDTLLCLMEVTDYYIMMQRHSIFDLSTLEAMQAGKALVLSAIGGNLEVNKEDNVILVDVNDINPALERLEKSDKYELGALNKKVFEEYFSERNFFDSYSKMIDEQLENLGIVFYPDSSMNKSTMPVWKNRYNGKTAVICGSGSSLDQCVQNSEYTYIALNKALFYDKVKFDFLFMQDEPKNQPYKFEDYNNYPCTKFYSKITNVATRSMGIDFAANVTLNDDVVRYELAPTWFDYRIDPITFKLDVQCFVDAQSVLFSAIQFAVYAGFTEIILYGVEFSEKNYGNHGNPNKYNPTVVKNLLRFKTEISKQYPQVWLGFGATSNDLLKEEFDKIDKGLCQNENFYR